MNNKPVVMSSIRKSFWKVLQQEAFTLGDIKQYFDFEHTQCYNKYCTKYNSNKLDLFFSNYSLKSS